MRGHYAHMTRILLVTVHVFAMLGACAHASSDTPRAEFFRGINLNGPPVVIDGHKWEGGDSKYLETRDQAFENQAVPLIPPTDPERARMIRSSRWNGRADLKLTNIPPATYVVYLYVWEDNDPETFSISLNGREVVHDYVSGSACTWKRLGPWRVVVDTGSIRLTTRGGAANLSGIEIWTGDGPVAEAGPPEPVKSSPPWDPVAAKAFDTEIAPMLARHCLGKCHGRSLRKGKLLARDRRRRADRRRERARHRARQAGREPDDRPCRVWRDAPRAAVTERYREAAAEAVGLPTVPDGGRRRSTRSS